MGNVGLSPPRFPAQQLTSRNRKVEKTMIMIETKKLRKVFGPIEAVKAVSFRVEKGEVLAFLGPNGAGKSTVMRMLTGFLTPTAGTATIEPYALSCAGVSIMISGTALPSRSSRR